MTAWQVLALEAGFLWAAMSLAWVAQRRTGNAGWVDAVWSAAAGLGAALAALAPQDIPGTAGGITPRQILAAVMAAAWGGRLAWHIARRSAAAREEDPRYAQFRRDWGAQFEWKLYAVLQIQAVVAWLLAATVFIAARAPGPLSAFDAAGVLVLAGSVAGEALADAQLARFRARGGGGICDTGLWGWSRHPNYFFEFTCWLAYPLLAWQPGGAQWRALAALCGPVMMLLLLRYGSGVPPLEQAMLRRRGDAFRAYQARVSVFFPLPPRRAP